MRFRGTRADAARGRRSQRSRADRVAMLALAVPALYLVAWTAALNDPSAELPRFGNPLNNLTVSVGREAIFACVVEDLGLYKVAWLRVDTQTILTISSHVITKNHRIAVTHSGSRVWSLHIRETLVTDRGWYMCQVNTDPMSSTSGFLEVVVPPDILDYPTSTDMMVREGSNVTLRCAATGTPEPTVTWRRESGSTIALSKWQQVSSFEGPELEITRVKRLHMGAYLCIASNGVPPTVSKRIVLTVHFPPMLRIENQLIGAYDGETLTLECHSEAFPPPITYWTTLFNETISNGGHYKVEASTSGYETLMKLTIRRIGPRDYGSYRCVSTNSLGETDGKIKIYKMDRRKPNPRRDSNSLWSHEHGYENTAAGMMEESSFKGEASNGSGDGRREDSSATTSRLGSTTTAQRLLQALCCCAAASVVARRLSS